MSSDNIITSLAIVLCFRCTSTGEVRRRARDLERRLTAEERARWDAVGSQRDAERAQQEEARQRAILNNVSPRPRINCACYGSVATSGNKNF